MVDYEEYEEEATYEEKVAEWTEFLPELLAAIEAGYLDGALKKIARRARDRYAEVHPEEVRLARSNTRAVAAAPALAGTGGMNHYGYDDSNPPAFLGEGGNKVAPVVRNFTGSAASAGHFRAFGHMYRKSDLVGQHFRVKKFNKLPDDSVARIIKVNKTTLELQIVWCPPGDPRSATSLGSTWRFNITGCARLFDN